MLEAGWQLYEGEYFRQRVEISSKELEFLTSRMTSLATTGSVLAGFAFNALVELDITQDVEEDLKDVGYVWIEDIYYIATGCTMAAGVFIVVVATIAVMKAQRQALHGHVELSFLREELPTNLGYRPGMIGENYQNAGMPRAGETPEERERRAMLQGQQTQNDDVQQAIFALRKVQPVLLFAFGASLGTFVIAATAMSWIKTVYHHKQVLKRDEDSWNTIAIILTTAFGMLGLAIVAVRTRARATARLPTRPLLPNRSNAARSFLVAGGVLDEQPLQRGHLPRLLDRCACAAPESARRASRHLTAGSAAYAAAKECGFLRIEIRLPQIFTTINSVNVPCIPAPSALTSCRPRIRRKANGNVLPDENEIG